MIGTQTVYIIKNGTLAIPAPWYVLYTYWKQQSIPAEASNIYWPLTDSKAAHWVHTNQAWQEVTAFVWPHSCSTSVFYQDSCAAAAATASLCITGNYDSTHSSLSSLDLILTAQTCTGYCTLGCRYCWCSLYWMHVVTWWCWLKC